MAAKKKLGSVKRFGARYGRRVKHKLAEIEAVQRGKHTCPYCRAKKVKRIAVGIWECKKCESKFTGKAYTIRKKSIKEGEKE
ncbi:MAG: 50S ribosomal protein L37ae [Candidatus Woesearchaeota archaeon]